MAQINTLAATVSGFADQIEAITVAVQALKDAQANPEIPADAQVQIDRLTAANAALAALVAKTPTPLIV